MRCSAIPARRAKLGSLFSMAVLLATGTPAAAAALEALVTQNTRKLMPYQVFELTSEHAARYESPLWDVTIDNNRNGSTMDTAAMEGP
ncbi:MAG: hypothetical protein ACYC35_04795 [Pirellulales bacterium]